MFGHLFFPLVIGAALIGNRPHGGGKRTGGFWPGSLDNCSSHWAIILAEIDQVVRANLE